MQVSYPATPFEREVFLLQHAPEEWRDPEQEAPTRSMCRSCGTPWPCQDRQEFDLAEAIEPDLADRVAEWDYHRQTGLDFQQLYWKGNWRELAVRRLMKLVPMMLESGPMRDYLREELTRDDG